MRNVERRVNAPLNGELLRQRLVGGAIKKKKTKNAPLNGELLRQRLVGGAIKKKKTKNAPPNNPLEPRVASPSDSVRRQPAPLGSARRSRHAFGAPLDCLIIRQKGGRYV